MLIDVGCPDLRAPCVRDSSILQTEILPEERTWLQQRNTEKLEAYFLCNRDLGRGFMPCEE
ncbi:MAG: hypothetical protein IJD60_02295 [Clostridia bacterium]|nr:hypothetical protein [Clostridia bacterium]